MKKIFAVILIFAFIFSLAGCGEAGEPTPLNADDPKVISCEAPGETPAQSAAEKHSGPEAAGLSFASGYEEIYDAIVERSASLYRGDGIYVTTDSAEIMEEPVAEAESSSYDAAVNNSADFSGTNVQVEGIDEGDIVKTDGEYIYVLREGRELLIIRAMGAESVIVSRTDIGAHKEIKTEAGYDSYSKTAGEMFIVGDRLVIVSGVCSYYEYSDDEGWHYDDSRRTEIDIYDVSEPESPVLVSNMAQDGYNIGTRLYGGRVYIVSRYNIYYYGGDIFPDMPGTYLPYTYAEGVGKAIAAEDICICPYSDSTSYVVAAAYDVERAEMLSVQSVLGAGSEVYMRGDNIYIAGTVFDDGASEPRREDVYTVVDYHQSSNTAIYRFGVTETGIELEAEGIVPGYMESQFSIDEHNGYARVVTTRNEYAYSVYTDEERDFVNYKWHEDMADTNGLYILDESLEVVGYVDDLAPGEQVYSARFDGDIAYFCTFEMVDPLFAVDLSVPSAPVVLSELKISGFSEYLHSWGEGRLFGFGYEADESTGWTEGLKLVMFDTTDKTDVGIAATHNLTDCYYSEALYDHHAFFIEPGKNIIGFVGDGDYYIFGYDEAKGFYQRAHFSFDIWEHSARGMYIGEEIYIVGQNSMYVLGLSDCAMLDRLEF